MIGQPPSEAVVFVAAIVVGVAASYVSVLRFADHQRPQWRDPLARSGLFAGIAIFAYSTFAFLRRVAGRSSDRDCARSPWPVVAGPPVADGP